MKYLSCSFFLVCFLGCQFLFAGNKQDTVWTEFKIHLNKPTDSISLIGNFNNFDKNADRLTSPDSAGWWRWRKKLSCGVYEYRFLQNDKIYLRDPLNPEFGGVNSNSLLYLDPPEKPHIRILSPLPGERIRQFPLKIRIQFRPGSGSKKVDTKKSRCFVDEKPIRLKFDQKQNLVFGEIQTLPEGKHFLRIRIQDKKRHTSREQRFIFLVDQFNQAPRAEAGYDLFCSPDEDFFLDGGLSSDEDLDSLVNFEWKVIDYPEMVDLMPALNSPFPPVRIRQAGDYRFSLKVSDGTQWSLPDTMVVHCRNFQHSRAFFSLSETVLKVYSPIHSISVAGEFNRWQAGVDQLHRSANGDWLLTKNLRPGQYEYKFVINDSVWIADPQNPYTVEDGWNGLNSVLTLPNPANDFEQVWGAQLLKKGFRFLRDGSAGYTLLQDENNPSRFYSAGDSLNFYSKPTGNYFFYGLPDDSICHAKQKPFLVKDEGDLRILDFWKTPGWVRDAVVYQVFLRTFGPDDSTTGTFKFLRGKLDYLQDLGVNCLWLMPVMESPTPHGYTPTNFFTPDSDYGSLADFDSLIADLHRRGMKYIFDFVANHTSDQHPYFLSAWKNTHSVYRDWYIWHGRYDYEFHNDWDQLPNLNYANPNVRNFILKVVKFWIDHGVDGFRCDAAWGVPHNFWKDFRRKVKSWNPQVVLIDEVLPRDPAFHDLEFDMSYDTDYYGNLLDVFGGRKTAQALQFGLQKTRSNYPPETVDFRYIENQDMQRFIAQFGPEATRVAATLLMTLPGMPLVYYGQEIGLTRPREPMPWDLAGNSLFRFYRKLIRLRNEHRAFRSETIEFVSNTAPEQVLSYRRNGWGESFLVVINFSENEADVVLNISAEETGDLIFDNRGRRAGIQRKDVRNLLLEPYEAIILQIDI